MDEITTAQEQLGRALTRARAGDDQALAGRVRDEGDRVVKLLSGLLEMARLHAPHNRAFDQPVKDFGGALALLLELLGAVHLLVIEDQVYVNDIRIRLENSDVGRHLGERLRHVGVGGFTFHAPLSDPQVRAFVAVLASELKEGGSRAALEQALTREGLRDVQLMGIHQFRLAGQAEAPSTRDAATTAQRGQELIDEALENLGANRMPNPLPLRRVVTELLESGAAEQLVETGEDTSAYAAHTLRVCNLSLLLGQALGLSSGALQDLGVAALFHDVGYAAEATAGAAAAPSGTSAFERHPVVAARLLLKQRGFHEAKIRRLMAALDHHRRYDDGRGVPSLFGRILALAEDYDTLTRLDCPRVHVPEPRGLGTGTRTRNQTNRARCSPHAALAAMSSGGSSIYDPTLLQLFVNLLGRYPPQTRVRLSDGSSGVVASLGRGAAGFERPIVRLAHRADGTPVAGETFVDLLTQRQLSIRGAVEEGGLKPATIQPSTSTAAPGHAQAVVPATAAPRPSVEPLSQFHRGPSAAARALDEGALPPILSDLFLGQKSGVLHLLHGAEHRAIRFVNGEVIHASSSQAADHQGEVVVREGVLRRDDLERAADIMDHEPQRLEAVLRELGLEDQGQLEEGLALHAVEVIRRAFAWRDGWWEFEQIDASPPMLTSVARRLSTADLILEAIRGLEDPDVVLFHLGDIDRAPRLSRHPRVLSLTVSLTPLDGFILSRVDGQLSIRDLMKIVPGDRDVLLRSLFGLLCVGLIEH